MNSPGAEFVELFLQEASEHLQFLREYGGVLLDPYPSPEEVDRLYLAAHTLKGSSAMYGYPLFAEVSAKLAHIFQYAMNVGISEEAAAPLVEFISEAVAVLESDLLMINDASAENAEEIAAFKQKYPFAFQPANAAEQESAQHSSEQQDSKYEDAEQQVPEQEQFAAEQQHPEPEIESQSTTVVPAVVEPAPNAPEASAAEVAEIAAATAPPAVPAPVAVEAERTAAVEPSSISEPEKTTQAAPVPAEVRTEPAVTTSAATIAASTPAVESNAKPVEIELPPDGEVPAEILEFFIPEAEEHLQAVTECLLTLENNSNAADVNRLFRAIHTVKGSAAQVGLPRIALVAHRTEDLIGRLRDGELKPSAAFIDLCFEAVDALKKFLYRQWQDEASMCSSVSKLLARIDQLAPEEPEHPEEQKHPEEQSQEALAVGSVAETPAEVALDGKQPTADAEEPVVDDLSALLDVPAEELEVSSITPPTAMPEREAAVGVSGQIIPQGEATNNVAANATTLPPVIAAPTTEPQKPTASEPATSDVVAPVAASHTGIPNIAVSVEAAAKPPASQTPTAHATQPATSVRLESLPQQPAAEAAEAAEIEAALVKKTGASLPQSKSVRIGLERLDHMMNAVGELVINRTRMLGRLAELEKLADVLNFSKARMSDKIVEFQDKYEFSRLHAPAADPVPSTSFPYRGGYSSYSHSFDASLAEFSELEMDRYDDFSILSRSLTEISADITEILTQLDTFVRRVDSDIDEFTKLAHRLQDEITAARMVPIGNLYTRISRTVRDAAKAAGKQVELELAGAETELDNNIIQQIGDPLLHLVRNAVAHGLESDEERYTAGKGDHGKVAVRAYHRGNHIYIEVEDDGRGIDWDHVRATAVNLGLLTSDDAARLTERDLQDLLFHPGFSTAPRKSELAGRGVGLDVVQTNINSLNGEIEIETQKGFGTRFTLKVPLTLIISQALFVRCGKQLFAFPLAFVEEIRRIRDIDIEDVGGKLLTKVRDVVTEVVRLDGQLGIERIQPVNGFYRLVIVNVAGRQVGVVVEEVLRKDEIVIKNLGEYLRNVKLFPGATVAPDGSLILLVDVNRLIAGEAIERRPLMTSANAATARIFAPGALAVAHGEIPPEAIDNIVEERLVVLADDSISVRKFVGRMLEKAGYRVRLAADGLDALEIVTQTRCDLVVTDLEMPRTNGYELMAHLRQNPETRDIPVMVVTSRAGAKHRDKAMRQGAADFLVKPVQEDQFIAAVAALIGNGTAVPQAKTAAVGK